MRKSDKIILFDIDYTIFDTDLLKKTKRKEFAVYAEVHQTLSELQKIAKLGIFSEGDIEFQKKKLKKTSVDKYFAKEHMHIVPAKNDVVKQILDMYTNTCQLYFIDDKLTSLHIAKQQLPDVITVWVKRGVYALAQQPIADFTADAVIENLAEIVPLIAREK